MEQGTIKEQTNKYLNNKSFQKAMDVIRILILIGVVAIIIILLVNINEVKLMNGDYCKLCSLKTGAECFFPIKQIPIMK